MMRIEVWSDVCCPFCGLGHFRLNQALRQFGRGRDVELVHRSFQLDADFPEGELMRSSDYVCGRERIPPAQYKAAVRNLEDAAKAEGLSPYHVADNTIGSTSAVHHFLAFATERGKNNQAWSLIFGAHFARRLPIWNVDDLAPLSHELGFDEREMRTALLSERYRERVSNDRHEASELGARGVPFICFNRRFALAGAQKAEALVEAMERAWAQAN